MSAYPEPPVSQTFSNSPGIHVQGGVENAPELPSRFWPWVIGIGAILAIGIQTWSLFGLLKAGKLESDFQAKVAAWESANQNRQEAIDTWNSIEKQVNANVDQLRDQSSLLQGTIDSLQKQRDQMVQTTTTQAKTLEVLQSNRNSLQTEVESLRAELADANAKKKGIDGSITLTEEQKKQLEEGNSALVERGKKIRTALAALETDVATTDAKAEAQKKLLDKSTAELAAMEARVAQFDTFLQNKLATAADFKLQQAKSAQAVKDLEATAAELDKQKAAVTKATAQLAALTKQLADLSAARDQGDVSLTSIKGDVDKAEATLADLRKKEQELSQRMATMTKAMNTAAADATKALGELSETAASTIQEMAAKAAEVRKAVNEIQVPANVPSPTSNSKTEGDASPIKEEGDK
jgi:chromosome segregation ATPase